MTMENRAIKTSKSRQTSIEDLPNELLSKILACLSLKHDLDNVQSVSKRWYAVVDETIGRDVAITSLKSDDAANVLSDFPCVPPAHLGCLGLDMISKMGIKTCYVELGHSDMNNLTANDKAKEEGQLDETDFMLFKFPHLLKSLYFNGCVRSDLFQSLLKGTENLTLLQMNLLALSQLAPVDLQYLQLAQLKALGVGKCVKTPGRNFDDVQGLPQLQTLLTKNRFPRVTTLDLRFPVRNFRYFGTLKAILKFLEGHLSLTELYVIMEFPVMVDILTNFQEEQMELMDMAKVHPNRKSLKTCEIQGIRLHASYPQLPIWHVFLEQQECLKSLTLRLGFLSAELLDQICRKNKASLVYIFLYKLNETVDPGEERHETVLDCRTFSVVTKLETLYALGCDRVTNAKSLPKSISNLIFSGILTSEDAEHILLEMPKMEFVSLKNACLNRNENYGVGLDLLKRFIQKRKLKRLILNGTSLNDKYPVQGLCNGDPKKPLQLMEFDNWDEEHMYIDWELNPDMYYMDKCY